MPRNMSFALTTDQMRRREKTVTRRFGWRFLKPGDVVNAVEKAMGLKKGEKINRICQIRIVSTREEPLNAITKEDCIREGFPSYEPEDFISMLTSQYKCDPTKSVNRIEYEFIDEIVGHHTLQDGTHVPFNKSEAEQLETITKTERERRATALPTTHSVLKNLITAHVRLHELGWRSGPTHPKDGSSFAVILFANPAIRTACFISEFSFSGLVELETGCTHPHGFVWKSLESLTDEEEAERQQTAKDIAAIAEHQLNSLMQDILRHKQSSQT